MSIYYSKAQNAFFDDALFGPRMISVIDTAAQAKALASAQEKDRAEYERALVAAGDDEAKQPDKGGFQKRQARVEADPIMMKVSNPDCRLPEDAIEISAEDHARFMEAQSAGSEIVPGVKGMPALRERVASVDDVIAGIRKTRDAMLAASDWTHALDSPLSQAKRKLWAAHRQALRDLPDLVAAALAEDPKASIEDLMPKAPN